MIDLYFWPTPNGWKISIALEEMGLAYNVIPTELGKGEQFTQEFEKISPSHRMPAIVDHEPLGQRAPFALAESGAILMYLAEKSGQFWPNETQDQYQALQWLLWQTNSTGPHDGPTRAFCALCQGKNSVCGRALSARSASAFQRARTAP